MTDVYFTHTVPIHQGQSGAWAAVVYEHREAAVCWGGLLNAPDCTPREALRCTFERCLELGLEELRLHSNSRTLVEALNQPAPTPPLPVGVTLCLDLDSDEMKSAVLHAFECAAQASGQPTAPPRIRWHKFTSSLSPYRREGCAARQK